MVAMAVSAIATSVLIKHPKFLYSTFLEILEIAHWILFAHRTNEPEDRKRYQDFEQKVFSYAEALGFEDLITYDEEFEKYFPKGRCKNKL